MCGIAGIFVGSQRSSGQDIETIAMKMANQLVRRGPDAGGSWSDVESGIALGHRRLAVIDLSETGSQPMHSASARYVVVLNGEIYNFRDLRAKLEHLGHAFRGSSDTEVLLNSIEEWGLDKALELIHGMFAFALWDREEKCLHLVRDRIGEKPLYYSVAKGKLIFASELKAFQMCPWWQAKLNYEALSQYFRYNHVPDPHCIFEDTFKLPPGCLLTVSLRNIENAKPRSYWSRKDMTAGLSGRSQNESLNQITAQFHDVLFSSVKRQLISDVPLGTFLSGGIDSSLITALAQEASTNSIKTFTVGFEESKYDESGFAREVAEILATDHTEVTLREEDALDLIPDLPSLYNEPFGDSSQIPTILVSRVARNHVTVVLGGDGGDELMAGYSRYFAALSRLKHWRTSLAAAKLRSYILNATHRLAPEAFAYVLTHMKKSSYDSGLIARKLLSIEELSKDSSPEKIYDRFVSSWLNCMNPAGTSEFGPMSNSTKSILWNHDPLKAMMLHDVENYLPGDILTKVDRAAMSVSLETRLPLLDHSVVQFCMGVPSEVHSLDGRGKWLGRQLLSKYLPSRLVDRKKTGFAAPVDEWLRGPLRTWADELLNKDKLIDQGIINAEIVDREWNWHKERRFSRAQPLWGVLMFQAWLEDQRMASQDMRSDQSVTERAIAI